MRKVISLLLVFCLLLTLTPVSVPALEQTFDAEENTAPAEPTQPPEAAEQEATRGKDHVARLHGEEGDHLNNLVFLNEDGSKTLYLYDHPVKYRDEKGEIHDISLDIADSDDTAYPFRTKANSAVTAFPAQLPDGITLTDGEVSIRMAPQIPTGSATDATATALNHRARRVDTQTVAYTYDAHTTIEYALTYAGFKEEIVVSQYTGQTEYHFILYTGGLSLTNIGGAYYLTDASGAIKAALGQVIVFTADERNNTFGEMRSQTVKENQIYALTIVLDPAYLADPKTAYPIRIDPTVTLTYEENGTGAIEDVTIQSENASYPEYPSVSVGLRSYGISRLLMRFPELDFTQYAGVTVTSATVSLRDLMCEETEMTVYCHVFGCDWTESTASWDTLPNQFWSSEIDSQVISYANGLMQESTHRYKFDISMAVETWIYGDTDPAKGIIFKADSTVENGTTLQSRVFGSFEQDGYKPIFEMTYTSAMTLDYPTKSIGVNDSFTLSASTRDGVLNNVTWYSENPEIATVSPSGVVTGINPGTATIVATSPDARAPAYCTVYVTLEDGVYYIKNLFSNDYLQVSAGSIGDDAYVCHMDKNALTDDNVIEVLPYMWKIKYLGDGKYSLRPMHKPDLGLTLVETDIENNPIGFTDYIGEVDSPDGVSSAAQWTISLDSLGYVLQQSGTDSATLYAPNTNRSTHPYVVAAEYDAAVLNCHWSLERIANEEVPSGAILYDTATSLEASQTKEILIGQTVTLEQLCLDAVFYSPISNNQTFTWVSSNPSVMSIDSNTGVVTCISPGVATILGTHVETGLTICYCMRTKQALTMGLGYKGGYFLEDDAYIISIANNGWGNMGYATSYYIDTDINVLKNSIENYEIVFLEGHGQQHMVELLRDVIISDAVETTDANTILLRDYNLSNVELFVLEACETASNLDGTGKNLSKTAYQMGAQCVLGWAESFYFEDQEIWQQRFQDKLSEGWTVNDAVRYANSFLYKSYLQETCPYCGFPVTSLREFERTCGSCNKVYAGTEYFDYCEIKATRIYGDSGKVLAAVEAVEKDYGSSYSAISESEIIEEDYDLNSKQDLLNLLGEYYDLSVTGNYKYTIKKTDTSEDGQDYIVDMIIGLSIVPGQLYGYTIIVENGQIVGMRDNTRNAQE